MIRKTKVVAAFLISMLGLLFFLDNLVNLSSAYGAVSFVVSGAEQPYYKTIGPVVNSNWLTWIALFTIMAGELFVGILGLLGAIQMIQKISGTADAFQNAKSNALLAGVAGMLLFYGFFIVIGETYFNMWQTAAGVTSVEGAFRYGSVCAILMFFIASKND